MKKLVEIDPATGRTKEFDLAKIERSAKTLKEYLLALDPKKDQYRLKELMLPIVDQALARSMKFPLDLRTMPLSYETTEGLLPREFGALSAPLFAAASGMSGLGSELLQPIVQNGKSYVWMEFEEPESLESN